MDVYYEMEGERVRPETIAVMKLIEDIRDIEQEILSLDERKSRLEYQLDEMIAPRSKGPEIVRRGRVPSENSSKKLIVSLLNDNPKNDYDADFVASKTGINLGTVRTNLSKLVKEGEIEKRSFNTYGALAAVAESPVKTEEATPEKIAS